MTNEPLSGAGEGVCTICADPVVEGASALCHQCGQRYHLVLTNKGDGKDCGEVWLNEDFLALEFGCARCVAEHRGLPPPPAAGSAAPGPTAQARVKHDNASARDVVRRKRR